MRREMRLKSSGRRLAPYGQLLRRDSGTVRGRLEVGSLGSIGITTDRRWRRTGIEYCPVLFWEMSSSSPEGWLAAFDGLQAWFAREIQSNCCKIGGSHRVLLVRASLERLRLFNHLLVLVSPHKGCSQIDS